MNYVTLSQCVDRTLVKIIEPMHDDSLILVFANAWTTIMVESEDDDAYLQSPYDRDKTRLVHSGYDKAELIEAGVIDHEDLEKIKAVRKRSLESQIAEAEHQLKNLQTQARLEGLT